MISITLICAAITVCVTLMTKTLIGVNIYGNEKIDFQITIEIFTDFVCGGVFGGLLMILSFTLAKKVKIEKCEVNFSSAEPKPDGRLI